MKVFVTGATGRPGPSRRCAADGRRCRGHRCCSYASEGRRPADLGANAVEVSLFDRDALSLRSPGTRWSATSPPRSRPASRRAPPDRRGRRTTGSGGKAHGTSWTRRSACGRRPLRPGVDRVPLRRRWRRRTSTSRRWSTRPWITESALAAEAEAARFTEHGGVGVALRFGDLLRLRQRPHDRDDQGGPGRRLRGSGTRRAYWSSVTTDDAASAVVAALRAPAGVYNVADDRPLTPGRACRRARQGARDRPAERAGHGGRPPPDDAP